jgi:hypothetical protein
VCIRVLTQIQKRAEERGISPENGHDRKSRKNIAARN